MSTRATPKQPVTMPSRQRRGLHLVVWIAVGIGSLLVGCEGNDPAAVPADVATSIDGEPIPYAAFEGYLDGILDQEEGLEATALSALFDQFLDEQLLLRLAIERGLVDEVADERQALALLLDVPDRADVEAELLAFYRAHPTRFSRPEQVHLRHILTHDRAEAEQARLALDAGDDFAEVAARFSQGPTAHLGGDQGTLGREDLPPYFADVIFALDPGATSDVLEADYGFQIFQVTQRRPASVVPYEEALPEIRAELRRRAADERLETLLLEARDRYNVRLFRSNLPFDYGGSYAGGPSSQPSDGGPNPSSDP
ncbi:MAG: peptidylprolyl isomerase [Acidobacteriota bacterium]